VARKKKSVTTGNKPGTAKPDSRTTHSVLPIRRVDGALIERTDVVGFSVLIVVQGILFDLLSPQEKDDILLRYQKALHMLNTPVQIVMQSIPVRIDAEIDRYRQVRAQYPGDRLPQLAQAIAAQLDAATQELEQPLYLYVATGATEAQARREADTLMHALASVHPDLRPRQPESEETLQLLAQCFGHDMTASASVYLPPWAEGGTSA